MQNLNMWGSGMNKTKGYNTCLKWALNTKMNNYFERNKKLSPLNQLEYMFLKHLYWYLSKQVLTEEIRQQTYKEYSKLMDLCFYPNQATINARMVDIIYLQCLNLLEREKHGAYSFILLNDEKHYLGMKKAIELFYNQALNKQDGHILDWKEFWENMKFIRKQFQALDFNYQIGKWPKKLRKRRRS
jgi:hypothetical protein